MNIRRFGLVAGSVLTVSGLVVACSDSDSGSSSGTNGTSDTSGTGAGGECKIAPGKYAVKYTTRPGGKGPAGQACPDIPATELDYTPEGDDGGVGEGCTRQVDKAACKTTIDCVTKLAGTTSTEHTEQTISGGTVKGFQQAKQVNDADGAVEFECTYDFEYTKK